MINKIYWYCFKRQCREFYEILVLYKLISCRLEVFMSHFTGKKFYDDDISMSDKIKWNGSKELLNATYKYLAEMGFIDKNIDSLNAMEQHFKHEEVPKAVNSKFLLSLKALFPETTGYRCKTRLFYKERNKKPFKVLQLCKDFKSDL